MQYLVVVDTNVLVSALLSKHDDASTVQVLKALYEDKFTPLPYETKRRFHACYWKYETFPY